MKRLFYLFIAIAIVACEEEEVVKAIELNEEFTLREGDTGILSEPSVSLKVERIDDSRCPDGAQCIWQGSADIIFSFESENSGLVVDTLRSFNKSVIHIDDLTIQLVDVSPYPELNKKKKNKGCKNFNNQKLSFTRIKN